MSLHTIPELATPDTVYPPLIDRIQSSFIDVLVTILLMAFCSNILDFFRDTPDWVSIVMFITVFIGYEPLFTSIGGTPGNFIKRIRVRQNGNISRRIYLHQAVLRYVFKLGLGWISFMTIHSNKQRRAIHDIVAGSVMIKV